ncbi:MAG TPA: hypothetical protein VFN49_10550 [Candidatus Aquilonibacter sp.]|nr:hypothetical protein [Candidatus Aquilonibacter sp.]
MAQGVIVFRSIGEAQRAGFYVYDRTPSGFIARTNLNGRWATALIEIV